MPRWQVWQSAIWQHWRMKSTLWLVLGAVGLVLIAAMKYCATRRKRQCALQAWTAPTAVSADTIFISVPSYRDSDTAATVASAFAAAREPKRVYVGVCAQWATAVDGDLRRRLTSALQAQAPHLPAAEVMRDHVRLWVMPHTEARGPMLARSLVETRLYRRERFYLCVDSHCRFAPEWDVSALRQWRACHHPRAILTTYPHPPGAGNRPTYLRFRQFHPKHGMPELESGELAVQTDDAPVPQTFVAACCAFGPAAAFVRDCPTDPHCPWAFIGEETSLALRLFSHGYRFFAPSQPLVSHRWDRGYRPTFWELQKGTGVSRERRQQVKAERKRAYVRLWSLLAGRFEGEACHNVAAGFDVRTYWLYCGIDPLAQHVEPRARRGMTPEPSEHERRCKQ